MFLMKRQKICPICWSFRKNISCNQNLTSKKEQRQQRESERTWIKHIKCLGKFKNQRESKSILKCNEPNIFYFDYQYNNNNKYSIIQSKIFPMNQSISSKLLITLYLIIVFLESSVAKKYTEELSVTGDGLVKVQFILDSQLLPFPLRQIMEEQQNKVEIRYGPYFHQMASSSNPKTCNTISTFLMNPQLINSKLKQVLEATFSVSIPHRYSFMQTVPQNYFIFNDPNDKFCRQHIQQIFRNFLPCSTHSGISQLIDLERFFQLNSKGISRYGMKVIWDKNQFSIQLYFEIQVLRKAKVNQKCLASSTLVMFDAKGESIGIKEMVISRIQQSLSKEIVEYKQSKLRLNHEILGSWYSPYKQLRIQIQSNTNLKNNSIIKISYLLPSRANVKEIKHFNFNTNQTDLSIVANCTNKNNDIQYKYKSPSLLCQIIVAIRNQVEVQSMVDFVVVLKMENKIICFDEYETIYGGGAQIPLLPVVLVQQNSQVSSYYAGPLSLRTPEPDQSLPFQVMTFVLAIFGYLWLSIWRRLVQDAQNQTSQKKQQKQYLSN